MRNLIRATLILAALLQANAYSITPGMYLGAHQGWGTLYEKRPVSGSSFGGSVNLFNMWDLHYQHSKKWGFTVNSSQHSTLDTPHLTYKPCMGTIIGKREVFQRWHLHAYLPIGIWGAVSEATSKVDNKPGTHYIPGLGMVLGGLGMQLNAYGVLLDTSYQLLWSFSRMDHTHILTVSLGVKLMDLSK